MMKVVPGMFCQQLCKGSKMGVIKSIGKFRSDFTEEVARQMVLKGWVTRSQKMGKSLKLKRRKGKYSM